MSQGTSENMLMTDIEDIPDMEEVPASISNQISHINKKNGQPVIVAPLVVSPTITSTSQNSKVKTSPNLKESSSIEIIPDVEDSLNKDSLHREETGLHKHHDEDPLHSTFTGQKDFPSSSQTEIEIPQKRKSKRATYLGIKRTLLLLISL